MLSQRIAAAMRRTHCAPRAWLVLTMHCLEQLSKDYGSTWQSWTASGHFWTTKDYMSFKCHSFKSSLVFCEVLCILHGKIKQDKTKRMHSEVGEDIWRPCHAKRPLVPSGARASPSPWHLPVFTWSRDFYPFDARGVDVKLLYILSRAEGYHILRKVMKSWSIVKHYILIYLDDLPSACMCFMVSL